MASSRESAAYIRTSVAVGPNPVRASRWRASDSIALIDGQALRQFRTGDEQPSTEVGAGRARAGILDDGAVLRKEEAGEHAIIVACEDVRHRAGPITAVNLQRSRVGCGTLHGVKRRERNHQLLAACVDPQRW